MKRAIVTGAGNGIGSAIARALATANYVVGVLDHDPDAARKTLRIHCPMLLHSPRMSPRRMRLNARLRNSARCRILSSAMQASCVLVH